MATRNERIKNFIMNMIPAEIYSIIRADTHFKKHWVFSIDADFSYQKFHNEMDELRPELINYLIHKTSANTGWYDLDELVKSK